MLEPTPLCRFRRAAHGRGARAHALRRRSRRRRAQHARAHRPPRRADADSRRKCRPPNRRPRSRAMATAPATSISKPGRHPVKGRLPHRRAHPARHMRPICPPDKANPARLTEARFYIANGFGAEALGLVNLMQATDPSLQDDKQLQTIKAAADVMMARYRDAYNALAGSAFDNDRHAALWRGLAEAGLEDWAGARKSLLKAMPVLNRYPADWQARARIAYADAAIAMPARSKPPTRRSAICPRTCPSRCSSIPNWRAPSSMPPKAAIATPMCCSRPCEKSGDPQRRRARDLCRRHRRPGRRRDDAERRHRPARKAALSLARRRARTRTPCASSARSISSRSAGATGWKSCASPRTASPMTISPARRRTICAPPSSNSSSRARPTRCRRSRRWRCSTTSST